MPEFTHKVLILDNEASFQSANSQAPSGVEITVCNTVKDALERIGIANEALDNTPATTIDHPYDIVLLDYGLHKADMDDYPLGGLTLQPLFKASFTKTKRGQCIVCCYSDKMAAEKPKARHVFELTERKLRGENGLSGLHQCGIAGIRWKELVQARANSILSDAPSDTFIEIAGALGKAPNTFGDFSLISLASYLGVASCTLNQLLARQGPLAEQELNWLKSWMWKRSLCHSTYSAYKALPKFTHAPRMDTRQLDVPIVFPTTTEGSHSIVGHCIPRELASDLIALQTEASALTGENKTADQARCQAAKKAFRLAVHHADGTHAQGYALSELADIIEFIEPAQQPSGMPSNVYVYVHKTVLKSLLQGLERAMHNRKPVKADDGRVRCHLKMDPTNRRVMFIMSQEHEITSTAAKAITDALGNGKPWGPFPDILSWGAVWLGCENGTVFSLAPNLPLNVGTSESPLKQNELAIVLPFHTS